VSPLSRICVALGDFTIHDEPAVSLLDPQPMILASIGGDQHHQSSWKSLFSSMTEVSSGEPTRFDAHAMKETRIDRVFVSLPAHAYPNVSRTLKVDKDPAVLSDRRLSDHALLDLTIAIAAPKTSDIQPIPAFIFQLRKRVCSRIIPFHGPYGGRIFPYWMSSNLRRLRDVPIYNISVFAKSKRSLRHSALSRK
ncbi:unnamed protein product, partial [Prorocentrum cordatum]